MDKRDGSFPALLQHGGGARMNRRRHSRVMVRIGLPAAATATVVVLGACSSLSGYATAGGSGPLASHSQFPPPPPVLSYEAPASANENAAVNGALAALLTRLTQLATETEASRQRLAELQAELDSARAQIERLPKRERLSPGNNPAVTPAPAESGNSRPFVRIRFGQPRVDYVDALSEAVQNALAQLPDAKFDVVAIAPVKSVERDTAERCAVNLDAEQVIADLLRLGVQPGQLAVSSAKDSVADIDEVRIYIW